jgi:hypothetical protein
MQRFHFLGIAFVIVSLCAACGDDSNDDDDDNGGTQTDAGSAGDAGSESKDAAAPDDDDTIEIAGDWHSEFGDELIDAKTWKGSKLVEFDNDDNVAITQYPKDDMYNPNKFAKQVWTEPTDDGFYYCTVEFMLDTLEEAQDSEMTADDSDPENGGCGEGDFPWTKLEPK